VDPFNVVVARIVSGLVMLVVGSYFSIGLLYLWSSKHVSGSVVTYQKLSNLVFNSVFEINESNRKIIQGSSLTVCLSEMTHLLTVC
jgi:hypothetical protein